MAIDTAAVQRVIPGDGDLVHVGAFDRFFSDAAGLVGKGIVAISTDGVSRLSERGLLSKKLVLNDFWPWAELESRTNVSEGPIDGRFSYTLSLFLQTGESLSFLHDMQGDRDALHQRVHSLPG